MVEGDPDGIDAQPDQAIERTEIRDLLDQHGIAARQQDAVDQFDALQRAGGDEDLIRRTGNAGVGLELADQKLAQPPIAERAAFQAIARKRTALAPEHGRCGRDQVRNRHLFGIIVPADEVVPREPVPFDRRGRQAGRQQRGEVERGGRGRDGGGGLGHGLSGRKALRPRLARTATAFQPIFCGGPAP